MDSLALSGAPDSRFWSEFALLYAASLLGALALTPYLLRLAAQSKKPRKVSPTTLAVAAFVQTAVLFALIVAGGLFVSRAVGLHATPAVDALLDGKPPSTEAVCALKLAAGLGGVLGLALLVTDLAILPRLPALLELSRKAAIWENLGASFYGGIDEELLTRLLGVSGVAWLFAWLSRSAPSHPSDLAFWSAIVVMAIIFGLGHLPATRAVAGRLTPLILARALFLNGLVAVPCGWLFWRYGIEAAIVTHFTVDIVYHVFGTMLLKLNDRVPILGWIPRSSPTPTDEA